MPMLIEALIFIAVAVLRTRKSSRDVAQVRVPPRQPRKIPAQPITQGVIPGAVRSLSSNHNRRSACIDSRQAELSYSRGWADGARLSADAKRPGSRGAR